MSTAGSKLNTSIRLDAELVAAAKAEAARRGQSFTTYVTRALIQAIKS